MTDANAPDAMADAFEQQRGRLLAVAYRMLGSRADAEDAVQEAWLRLSRQDSATIDNLPGWLTTVVGRVCIDALRSRRTRSESSYDEQLPDLIVTEDVDPSPEDDVLLADSVGVAFLMVLDSLGPAERLAFVLHDMFAVPFGEIGQIIGRSTDATKMLASRARRKVQDAPRSADDPRQQRSVVNAFLAAARDGDFDGLLRLLDPDASWHTFTAHDVQIKLGATEVARQAQRAVQVKATAHPARVNGGPGVVARAANGKPVGVLACTVIDGRIVEVLAVTDPARLAAMDIPDPRNE